MSTVVFITGSSTGFGRASAETLARRGYTVVATMRDISGKNAVHSESLRSLAQQEQLPLHVLELDVTNDASVSQAVQSALQQFGRIDVVVNNAGVAALGVTEAFTVEQFERVFDINVFGVVRVNRAVLPAMRRQRSGLLIHVSSAAGRLAAPCMAAYCGSKFALEAVADAYRFELAPFGIDSVIVEPGIHRTPILENFTGPADQERVADYGSVAEYAARVKAVFEAGAVAPQTPGAQEVADAFLQLIETPPGQRPFRTVPTPAIRPLLESYNAVAAELRQGLAQMFNVTELLTLQRTTAAGSLKP